MSLIVRTFTRMLLPFVVLYGIYIVLHGHVTPGGGFQGGVIIATSVLMLLLANGYGSSPALPKETWVEVAESLGGLSLVMTGLLGLLSGGYFLQNVFPHGEIGSLLSAGNLPLLNIGVGVKVAAGFIVVFYLILGSETES